MSHSTPTISKSTKGILLALAYVLSFAPFVSSASAQRLLDRDEIKELNGVEVTEHLGNHVPLDATFTNSKGEEIELGVYFDESTPVILALVYYECPVVCPVVLSQLAASLSELDYDAGEDFRVLVISFDHTETTTMAMGERSNFLGLYNRGESSDALQGIEFHTGDAVNIKRLVNSVGFNFNPLNDGEYAHPISLMVLSPKGKVTRYMYGFDYPAQELKLSLLDASQGKIAASLGDRLLHFCYRYDPLAGSYSLQAFRVMQVGALLTVVLIIIGLTVLFMGDRVRRKLYLAQQAQKTDEHNHDSHSSKTSSGDIARAHTGHVS